MVQLIFSAGDIIFVAALLFTTLSSSEILSTISFRLMICDIHDEIGVTTNKKFISETSIIAVQGYRNLH